MKASGGIEFWVKITPEEFAKLENEKLEGTLHFMEENPPTDRNIPIIFQRVRKYRQEIDVKCFPSRVYFGAAEKIIVTIDDWHYEKLKETGSTGDRFMDIGKVYIDVK